MNEKAMEEFGLRFAPPMPDMESHLENDCCPTCGQPWPEGNAEIDMDMSKIDEVLQAAK